jgi:hypothetical protein
MLAATALFVLSISSRDSGREAMEIVESARHATALGTDLRA